MMVKFVLGGLGWLGRGDYAQFWDSSQGEAMPSLGLPARQPASPNKPARPRHSQQLRLPDYNPARSFDRAKC